MTDEEAALVEKIRGGDAEALGDYIRLVEPQLLGFIEKNMSDALRQKVEACDILAEASMSAVTSFAEMDLSERTPFSWLCQLSERRIIDAYRRHVGAQKRSADREVGIDAPRGSDEGGIIDILVASMTTPSRAFSRNQKEQKLAIAIGQLPEGQREAIRLRYIEGWPSKQIAGHLGKTDGAVRVMLTRTLGKLEEILRDDSAFQSYLSPNEVDDPKAE